MKWPHPRGHFIVICSSSLNIKFCYIYSVRLLLILLLLAPCYVMGQLHGVSVTLLSTEQGLAEKDIVCAEQDKDGFMWLGTGSGLYRYDGYTFINYAGKLAARSGSENLRVTDMIKDTAGNIWLAYSRGVAIIPRGTDTLQWVKDPVVNYQPRGIFLDHSGKCWVCCFDKQLYVLDKKQQCISRHFTDQKDLSGHIVFFYEDDNSNVWLLSNDGSADVFRHNGAFIAHLSAANIGKDTGVVAIDFRLRDHTIRQHRFRSYDLAGLNIPLPHPSINPAFFADNTLISYEDNNGNIVKANTTTCKIWYNGNKDSMDISPALLKATGHLDYIKDIFQSKDNTLWMCCARGLIKLNYERNYFHNYLSKQALNKDNIGVSVRGMTEDENGNVWIGTYETTVDGKKRSLFKIDATTKNIEPVTVKYIHPYHQRTDDCYSLLADGNKLWITKEGSAIFYLDMRNNEAYEAGKYNSSERYIITNIAKASDSSLYFGGYSSMGILYPFRSTGAYVYFDTGENHIANTRVNNILQLAKGNYWVSTFTGIYHLDKDARIIKQYNEKGAGGIKLPSHIIYTLYFDKSGTLWAGSKSGLLKIDTGKHTVMQYTEKNGLCNNNVYAIVPDEWGYLWLSTNYGLSRFNPRTGLFINYYASDNLPNNEFNHMSYLKASDGRIYFGGINGFTAFYPKDIDTSFSTLPVRLISVSKFEGKQDTITNVTSEVAASGKVTLGYMDKLLSFNVMIPSFGNPSENRFSYWLEGWDKEWQFVKGSNTIAYSYLPAGNYKLHIRGARPGETWSRNELVIEVTVLRAWFKTWWFYTLCALGALGLGYMLYRIRLQQVLRDQTLRNKISADLHDELGTVLTQISIQSELLKSDIYSEQEKEKELDNITTSSRLAINAMSDIVWTIKTGTDRMADLIDRMRDHADMVLLPQNVDLSFNVADVDEQAIVPAKVKQQIFFIFKEAMHNILQHSDEPRVTVDIAGGDGTFTMSITNDRVTGKKKVEKIGGNGLKNMQMRAAMIKGTIETVRNGDTFSVNFKCKI